MQGAGHLKNSVYHTRANQIYKAIEYSIGRAIWIVNSFKKSINLFLKMKSFYMCIYETRNKVALAH